MSDPESRCVGPPCGRAGLKPPRKPRHPWTPTDTDTLRRLTAERKWSDRDLAYMMDRPIVTISTNRRRLGLPSYGKPGASGWKHSPEVCARLSERNRQRWRDPAYREAHLAQLQAAREASIAKRPKIPPRKTPEYRQYRKLLTILGPTEARDAWLIQQRVAPSACAT